MRRADCASIVLRVHAPAQGLGGREELAAEPRLQLMDLRAVGVEKLGHQRKIARMIAAL